MIGMSCYTYCFIKTHQNFDKTTTPKNFYHPNQLSRRCLVESFNSWLAVRLGGVVQTRWLNLANLYLEKYTKTFMKYEASIYDIFYYNIGIRNMKL